MTPSFNQARFLGETLRSVLAQREDLDEYFVFDGGSTDGSVEVIRRYADGITDWSSAPDGGQAAAIDAGIRRAKSDIVGWVNSDDVLLPGAIRRVRQAFADDPRAEVALGWCVHIDAESRVLSIRRPPRQTLAAARWGVTHIAQPACFFRRELYERVGGIDRDLACVLDTELWLRMLQKSPQWLHVPAVLAAFRVHPGSKGQAWTARYATEHALLRRRYPEFANSGLRHLVGRAVYRASELVTLRWIKDAFLSRSCRGMPLSEILEGMELR